MPGIFFPLGQPKGNCLPTSSIPQRSEDNNEDCPDGKQVDTQPVGYRCPSSLCLGSGLRTVCARIKWPATALFMMPCAEARWCPHRHRMARLHVIIACCLPSDDGTPVKVNGHPPSLQSALRCNATVPGHASHTRGSRETRRTHHLSPRGYWHTDKKPENVPVGRRQQQLSPGRGYPLCCVVGSERAGAPSTSTYLPAVLTAWSLIAGWDKECRLGGGIPGRVQTPTVQGKPPRKPFVPDGSLPLPLKQIFGYPWPVATPKSRGVTPFAGSICRQGASDAMPSISTTCTHSGPADCSVAPTSIHAAFHPAVHACRAASGLDSWGLSGGGHWTLPDSIWDRQGEQSRPVDCVVVAGARRSAPT